MRYVSVNSLSCFWHFVYSVMLTIDSLSCPGIFLSLIDLTWFEILSFQLFQSSVVAVMKVLLDTELVLSRVNTEVHGSAYIWQRARGAQWIIKHCRNAVYCIHGFPSFVIKAVAAARADGGCKWRPDTAAVEFDLRLHLPFHPCNPPLLIPPHSLIPFPSSDRPRCVFIAPWCRDVSVIDGSEMRDASPCSDLSMILVCEAVQWPRVTPPQSPFRFIDRGQCTEPPPYADCCMQLSTTLTNRRRWRFKLISAALVCLWVFDGPETHATHSNDMTTVLWYLASRLCNLFPR